WSSIRWVGIGASVGVVGQKPGWVACCLRRLLRSAVPELAAVGGMALPAVVFAVTVTLLGDPAALGGWAIPTATDIAFALGVLAIFGRGLPVALRVFLLTLAVVDDLLAIGVIAVFYTDTISWPALAASLGAVAVFGLVTRTRYARWWLLLPIAAVAWGFMHASGVHATIAGVLLGLTVAARPIHGETEARVPRYEPLVRPTAALVALAVFGLVTRTRYARWWLLLPIAAVAWGFMHAAGVHATIAGVLLGLTVAARPIHGETESRVHRYEHLVRPISALVALPVFALFAAGVNLVDGDGVAAILTEPVLPAVVGGLLIGKIAGVLGVTALVTRVTPLRLPDAIGLRDLLPVGFLTGIGFTVSLLIAELSYTDATHGDAATLGVLLGTVLAAVLAAATLQWDAHQARQADMNDDGEPDHDHRAIGGVDDPG